MLEWLIADDGVVSSIHAKDDFARGSLSRLDGSVHVARPLGRRLRSSPHDAQMSGRSDQRRKVRRHLADSERRHTSATQRRDRRPIGIAVVDGLGSAAA